jgi:hypothetical protein
MENRNNGNNQRPRPSLERLLRDRFAMFLGESNGRSYHRKAPHGTAPLWSFVQDQQLVARDHYGPLSRLIRLTVTEVFERVRTRGWDAYVVGGTLRDLVSDSSKSGFRKVNPRDIDVVVVDVAVHDLAKCFSDMIARRTRFGGLHLVKRIANVCEVHFDVWPLADTWAMKEYGITPEISQFPSTPFLNLDAVAIDLYAKPGHARAVYENGFYDGMAAKFIDINFERNPYPDVCAIRALIMAAKLQFALSPRLASFISSGTNDQQLVLERLQQAQLSHYGQIRCCDAELRSWLTSIRRQLSMGSERIEIKVPHARQRGLWEDYPPVQKSGSFLSRNAGESQVPDSPSSPISATN